MSTQTQTAPCDPQQGQTLPRSIERVCSVPLVGDSLKAVDQAPLQNYLTSWPYATARSVSQSAYSTAAPLAGPVLKPVDGLANDCIDFVQQRYPYPFETPSGQVYKDVQEVAAQTYETRVKQPVVGLAVGADQTLVPIVDMLQTACDKLGSKTGQNGAPNGAPSNETQVARALRLTTGLKDQVIVLSAEQLKQLQAQSAVVQRLTDAVYQLNALVAQTVTTTKDKSAELTKDATARASALADASRAELDKLSSALASLPAHLQQTLQPVRDRVHELSTSLASTARGDAPAAEKLSHVGSLLREKAPPVLEEALKVVREAFVGALAYARGQAEHAQDKAQQNGAPTQNGKGRYAQ